MQETILETIKEYLEKNAVRVNKEYDDFYKLEISKKDYLTFCVYEIVNFVGNEVTVIEITENDDPTSIEYIHNSHLSKLKSWIEQAKQ